MGNVIGDILPMAIGVALSPIPIVAVILMLFSKKARSNGPAFLIGWILGLAIVGGIILMLANAGKVMEGGTPSTIAYVIKLLLGLLFLVMAYRNWKKRPKEGETAPMPKWMEGIDAFTSGKSLGLAFFLSGLNPKNLALNLAATSIIAQAGLSTTQSWIALVVFVFIASLSVGIPVIYYLVAGSSAEKTLMGWKAWLVQNNATVMMLLLLVFGVMMIGKGIAGLTQ